MKIRDEILEDLLLLDSDDSILSNKVCSPLSFLIFLDIIACYCNSDLEEKINAILKDFDYSREVFLEVIQNLKSTETKLNYAASFWHNEIFNPQNIKFPYFEIFEVDFTSKKSLQLVNSWIKQKTNKLIKNIPPPDSITQINSIFLSTLYFKSLWINKFDSPSYPEVFYLANGQKINVGYLSKQSKEPISFFQEKSFQAIALPYKENNIQLEVYLPNKEVSFEHFISKLGNLNLIRVNSKFKKISNYLLSIPKFEVSSTIDLNPILEKNGLSDLFEFKRESYFDRKSIIKQEIVAKVNEKGTEAAAITHLMDIGNLPIFEVEFIANRPFLFLIRENNSNAILFLGAITNPKEFKATDNLWKKIKRFFR